MARAILENSKDKTKVQLIYANVTHEDILLKVSPSFRIYLCMCALREYDFVCISMLAYVHASANEKGVTHG